MLVAHAGPLGSPPSMSMIWIGLLSVRLVESSIFESDLLACDDDDNDDTDTSKTCHVQPAF